MNIPDDKNCYDFFDYLTESIAIYETPDGENFIFRDFNKQAEKTENIKKEKVLGKNVIDVFPGIIDFGLLDVFKRVYKTGISENLPLKVYEDGRISGWRENYVHKLSNNTIIAIYDDLTRVKQLESSLKETKGQFRDFFENNRAVILKIDSETRKIISCNKAASSFYGYSISELKCKTIEELAVLSIKKIETKITNAIKNKSIFFKIKHKLANNEIRDVEVYVSPIKVKNKVLLFAIIHDITARVKSQEKYIENQRLSAIGEMASSIAHDFNNSLQTISGNIELCAYDLIDLKPDILERLKVIQENIEDTAKRVNSLLKFSGYTEYESKLENIKINKVIDNVILQTRPLWKTIADKKGISIRIIKKYEGDFFIKGNKELLISAFFNILKNSIEAMPSGGELYLSIDEIESKVHIIIKKLYL